MTLTRGFIRNAATTPLDARLADMAKIACNADGSPRVGILGGANPSIVTTTNGLSVNVAAAEFVTSKGKADGVAIFTNDGIVSVPIAAAPASNSRITVIWVKHNDDTTGDPAGQATPVFGTTNGTAAASPTKPSIPTGALELATLRMYAGTTATNGGSNTLTNTYQMTAMRGGVVPFRTKAEMDAWTTPTAGQLAYCIAEAAAFEYIGVTGGANVGWLHMQGKPIYGALSYPGGYSAGSPVPRTVQQGGRVFLQGRIVSPSASYTAGTFYFCGTIADAAAFPADDLSFVANVNDVFGVLRIRASDGQMTFTPSQSFTGTLQLNLNGYSWPDKRLVP